jgi:hypothetical protein
MRTKPMRGSGSGSGSQSEPLHYVDTAKGESRYGVNLGIDLLKVGRPDTKALGTSLR